MHQSPDAFTLITPHSPLRVFIPRPRAAAPACCNPPASSCRRRSLCRPRCRAISRRMILPLRVLGRAPVKRTSSGWASAPISLRTCFFSSSRSFSSAGPPLSVTNTATASPFTSSGRPTAAASATRGWLTRRTFDLDRAQPVPGHVQHVVDPPHDPVIAVLVAPGVVAGQVIVRHLFPILLGVAGVVTPDAAQHARPRLGNDQPAAMPFVDRPAPIVDDRRHDARQRLGAAPRLGGDRAWQRAHHDSPRLGLPPRVDDRAASRPILRWYHIQASGLIPSPTVPSSRRLDRSCMIDPVDRPT